jgi:hypothetical protein
VRTDILSAYGASESEVEELTAYNRNRFDLSGWTIPEKFPLEDEDFVGTWQGYIQASGKQGVLPVLREALVQLSFPILPGISSTDGYRAVVRQGVSPHLVREATDLEIRHPESLRLILHPTIAGRIPVLLTSDRSDFSSLVQALANRNEPMDVPASMGATMVHGYNNWDRIRAWRSQWERDRPTPPEEVEWQEEFSRLAARKERYQDRFILACDGPYSAVSAEEIGVSDDEWIVLSRSIRLAHESTHYATKRLFGSASNNLLDEIIADYFGIVAAAGTYRSDWLLRFLGLENYPRYRVGGRMENYRGTPPLSDGAFRVLQTLVIQAAKNLELFHIRHSTNHTNWQGQFEILTELAGMTLEQLAVYRTETQQDENPLKAP